MDVDDLPVRGEWVVGSTAAMAIKCLFWASLFGAVLLLVIRAVRTSSRRN